MPSHDLPWLAWPAFGAHARARQPARRSFGDCGFRRAGGVRNRPVMAAPPPNAAAPNAASARIDKALARIEAAATARAYNVERLTRRHTVLREKIEDAVASLDALIAREKVEAD